MLEKTSNLEELEGISLHTVDLSNTKLYYIVLNKNFISKEIIEWMIDNYLRPMKNSELNILLPEIERHYNRGNINLPYNFFVVLDDVFFVDKNCYIWFCKQINSVSASIIQENDIDSGDLNWNKNCCFWVVKMNKKDL